MKKLFVALVFISKVGISNNNCASFTGTWVGKCVGIEAGVGGPMEFEVRQSDCKSIFFVDHELTLDGITHPAGKNARYKAKWSTDFGEKAVGYIIAIQYDSNFQGIHFQVNNSLYGDDKRRFFISRKSTRFTFGEEEPLESCTFNRL